MKKFIIKGLIFSVILAACIHICNQAFLKTDPCYGLEHFDDVPGKIDICNVGASHSMLSFNYEDYENCLNTANFGLPSQSHVYDYHLLKYYKKHLKKGTIVLMVVSFPMLVGPCEVNGAEWDTIKLRYYRILPPKYIREFDRKTWLEMQLVPFIYANSISDLVKTIKINYENAWQRKLIVDDYNSFEETAKWTAKKHVVTGKIDENGNMIYLQEAIDAIYEMIDLCKERGAIPILITPPFTDRYIENVKKEAPQYYYHGFYDIIAEIQKDTGVEYYDYSMDKRFAKKYSEFANVDHLNKNGARTFTKIVMEEVVGNRLKIKETNYE